MMDNNSEKVLDWNSEFTGVFETDDGTLFFATAAGEMLKFKEGQLKVCTCY